jgi:acylphosphatase
LGVVWNPVCALPFRMDDERVRRRAIIHGRVQGVGFRWSARAEAQRLGLDGFVGNRADSTVEAELEGPARAVAAMLEWLAHGPPAAAVTAVDVIDLPVTHDARFEVR